ncbi:hypothetical protein [Ectobacillus antri]|uniref:hypothetical protein n=1 Tax=Ectobacillus antri TaxID=2486280 RepID=UPI0013DDA0DB|nr:hypothetical protein [Ectobacillus antri]
MLWMVLGIIGVAVIFGIMKSFGANENSRSLSERELQEIERNKTNPMPPGSPPDGGL